MNKWVDVTTSEQPHPFSADRPIDQKSEDRLNRGAFSTAIAESVERWNGRDSLVIGIYGGWGSGKTSIINLTIEHLKASEGPPDIVRFNPWEWSGHDQLATAFFREVSLILKQRKNTKLAVLFQRYARTLNAGANIVGSISPVFASISALLLALGAASAFLEGSVATTALVTLGTSGLVASRLKGVAQAITDAITQKQPERQDISSVKDALSTELRTQAKSIVVVVDDLDRLMPDDAVRMLQLVKANADLPKMTYILACDLDALARNIQATLHVNGTEYIEKIIQVPLHVPTPDSVALERMLLPALDKILAPQAIERSFSQDRWTAIYRDGYNTIGMNALFTTPRRVLRFLSMCEFDLARHLDKGEYNVDPVDFLGVEVMRVLEPKLFQLISEEKAELSGQSTSDAAKSAPTRLLVEGFLDQISNRRQREAAKHILCELFPKAQFALMGMQSHVYWESYLGQRRVAHPDVFDFYFQMSVPSGDLSEGEIREMVSLARKGPEELASGLLRLAQTHRMGKFLRALESDHSRIPSGLELTVIEALFEIDESLEDSSQAFITSDYRRTEFLIEDLFRLMPSIRRLDALEGIARRSGGLSLILDFIRFELPRSRSDPPAIEDEDGLRRLGREIGSRIPALAGNQVLLSHPHLVHLMYAWLQLVDADGVKEWAESQAQSIHGLIRLFQTFVGYGSSDGRHPLEDFIDLDAAILRADQWLAQEETLDNITASNLREALGEVRNYFRHRGRVDSSEPDLDQSLS